MDMTRIIHAEIPDCHYFGVNSIDIDPKFLDIIAEIPEIIIEDFYEIVEEINLGPVPRNYFILPENLIDIYNGLMEIWIDDVEFEELRERLVNEMIHH